MHALVQKHSPHHKQQLLTLMARWGRTFGHVAFRHPTPLGPNISYTRSVWAIAPSIMVRRSQATTLERQLSARIGEQIKYASGERGLHITCYSTCMGNYQTASCSSSVGPSLGWAFYLAKVLSQSGHCVSCGAATLKLKSAIGSSGLASSTVALMLQSAFGSTKLERIGFEHGGLEASKCIWLELARADGLRAWWS